MNNSLDLRPRHWCLHLVPHSHSKHVNIVAANYAAHAPLIILDCGRQYDASLVARAAHGRKEIMDRIGIQRAFICSETTRLIQQTPAGKRPVVILDLLSSFYDENVRMSTRIYLFGRILVHLERLSRGAGLAVIVPPPPSPSDYFLNRLIDSAPRVLPYHIPPSSSQQLKLF